MVRTRSWARLEDGQLVLFAIVRQSREANPSRRGDAPFRPECRAPVCQCYRLAWKKQHIERWGAGSGGLWWRRDFDSSGKR